MNYDDWKLATPPENDTKCHECGRECSDWDLHILIINFRAIDVCSDCLDKLTIND